MSCTVPATVGMKCNYSPDGTNQYELTVVTLGFSNHVNGTYMIGTTQHTATSVPNSACCVANSWGCPSQSCIGTNAWRVLSTREDKVPV